MTVLGWTLVTGAVMAAIVAGLPALARTRRAAMDDRARATAPGTFAHLDDGITHFTWHGRAGGPVAVLVHGLTTPSFVWAGIVPALTAAGYHVLTYDLFGRGFSDRPRNRQTGAFFSRQLAGLLEHQMISGPAMLVGYSMGGAIVTDFACRQPERVSRLVLLAPAGFHTLPGGLAGFIRRSPGIGDWLMAVFGGARMRAATRRETTEGSVIPDITELVMRETRFRGYARSVLSSLRNLLAQPFDAAHRDLARRRIPTLAIWGAEDDVIPPEGAERLTAANPGVTNVVIEGADHTLAYTRAEAVGRAITDWIEATP